MTTPRRLLAATIIAMLLLAIFLGVRENLSDSDGTASTPIAADVRPAEVLAAPKGEFSPEEWLAALNDACSTETAELADKEWTQEEVQEQIAKISTLKQNLSVSASAEHLHLAALLEDDPSLRVDLLGQATLRSPHDPFLIWAAVQTCSASLISRDCPLRDWEQRLIAVDGQNSESWIRVAANRYAADELDTALEALRHASTAAESRAYWTEMIEMIERGFAAGSDYTFPERVSIAFGIAASEQPRYGDYVSMCKEQSAQSVDWAHACLAYGELVENQGKTEMGVAIARSIQIIALNALGELENAAAVEQQLQARRQGSLASVADYNPQIERLMFSNPALFSTYLATIKSDGEEAAKRRMTVEIERLIEQRSLPACE